MNTIACPSCQQSFIGDPSEVGVCPHCGEDVDAPNGDPIRATRGILVPYAIGNLRFWLWIPALLFTVVLFADIWRWVSRYPDEPLLFLGWLFLGAGTQPLAIAVLHWGLIHGIGRARAWALYTVLAYLGLVVLALCREAVALLDETLAPTVAGSGTSIGAGILWLLLALLLTFNLTERGLFAFVRSLNGKCPNCRRSLTVPIKAGRAWKCPQCGLTVDWRRKE